MLNGRFLVAAAFLLAIGEAAILMVFGDTSITSLGGYAKYSLVVAGAGTAVLLVFHQRKLVGLSFGGVGLATAFLFKMAVVVRALSTGISRWWGSERVQLLWAQLREDTLVLSVFSLILACLGWYIFVFTFPAQSEKVTDMIKEAYKKVTTGFLVMAPSGPAAQHARVASPPTVQASPAIPAARQIGNDPLLEILLGQGLVTQPNAPAVPTKSCPLCAHKTATSTKFCPECGFNYTVTVSSSRTERVSLVCGHCGKVATRPGNRCNNCGQPLITSAQSVAAPARTHCSDPTCNDKLEPGAQWCVKCGKRVT